MVGRLKRVALNRQIAANLTILGAKALCLVEGLGSLMAMSLKTYLAALSRGVDLVAECEGMSAAQLISLGATSADAAELLALHSTYFGPTSFSKKQRTAVAHARNQQHSLSTLRRIEHFVSRVKKKVAAWNLRVELCAAASPEVERLARKRLKEMQPPRVASERATLRQHPNGLATLTVTGSSMGITDVFKGIDQSRPGASFLESQSEGGVRTQATTMVVVRLEDYCELQRGNGRGDGDVILRTTSGATMTGAEYLEHTFSGEGFVTLISREEGPVDLYRMSCFASPKQRKMLSAENPTCAWPDCKVPAERCQIHHIEPWGHGGETNVSNMVPLCSYHNGVNGDDPNAPPERGRMLRIGGRVAWQPPYEAPPTFVT